MTFRRSFTWQVLVIWRLRISTTFILPGQEHPRRSAWHRCEFLGEDQTVRKRRAALADAAGTALAGTAPRQGSITQRQEKTEYDGPVRVCVNGLRCQAGRSASTRAHDVGRPAAGSAQTIQLGRARLECWHQWAADEAPERRVGVAS